MLHRLAFGIENSPHIYPDSKKRNQHLLLESYNLQHIIVYYPVKNQMQKKVITICQTMNVSITGIGRYE